MTPSKWKSEITVPIPFKLSQDNSFKDNDSQDGPESEKFVSLRNRVDNILTRSGQ
jgi:hypothetical protein